MHLRNSSFSEKNETRLKNVYLKEIWFIWFPSLILHLVLVLAFTTKYNRLIYQWYFKVLLHTGKFYTCILYICFLLLAGLFDLDRMRHWTRHLKSRANDYDYEFPLLSILSHISPFSHTRITWAWLLMASIHCARRLPQVLLVSGSVLFDPPSFQFQNELLDMWWSSHCVRQSSHPPGGLSVSIVTTAMLPSVLLPPSLTPFHILFHYNWFSSSNTIHKRAVDRTNQKLTSFQVFLIKLDYYPHCIIYLPVITIFVNLPWSRYINGSLVLCKSLPPARSCICTFNFA